MPASYTPLGFIKQATGENESVWGDFLNNGGLALIDEAIRGRVAFSLSGSRTLTSTNGVDTEARKAILHVTGGTGGTVTIPNYSKAYFVVNEATGSVVVTAGGAQTATVAAGETTVVVSDGSNVRTLQIGGMSLKAYIDAQAFAATNLPGITPGTAGQSVTNDGADASWGDVYPPLRRVTRTANTILGVADRGRYVDVTSGTFTQTVTASATLGDGWYLDYGNSGTGVVTIDPAGSETIGGAATLAVNPGEIYRIQCDASNLNVIALKTDLGPHIIVQDQVGGVSGVVATWADRNLTTVVTNLVGASLASNHVTLPAGSWHIEASAPFSRTQATRIRVRNITDGTTAFAGQVVGVWDIQSQSGDDSCVLVNASGRVTISSPKAFAVQYYAETMGGLGMSSLDGLTPVFAIFEATRVS